VRRGIADRRARAQRRSERSCHEDLERSLTAMTVPPTSAREAVALLEALRIGMTAHAIDQTMVFRDLLDLPAPAWSFNERA
jgi:hypothetical protein